MTTTARTTRTLARRPGARAARTSNRSSKYIADLKEKAAAARARRSRASAASRAATRLTTSSSPTRRSSSPPRTRRSFRGASSGRRRRTRKSRQTPRVATTRARSCATSQVQGGAPRTAGGAGAGADAGRAPTAADQAAEGGRADPGAGDKSGGGSPWAMGLTRVQAPALGPLMVGAAQKQRWGPPAATGGEAAAASAAAAHYMQQQKGQQQRQGQGAPAMLRMRPPNLSVPRRKSAHARAEEKLVRARTLPHESSSARCRG